MWHGKAQPPQDPLTPFRDQKIVEGCLAWHRAQEVSSGCGRNVEEDGLAKTGRMAK